MKSSMVYKVSSLCQVHIYNKALECDVSEGNCKGMWYFT